MQCTLAENPALIPVRLFWDYSVYQRVTPLLTAQCVVGDVFSMVKQREKVTINLCCYRSYECLGFSAPFFMPTRSAVPCQEGGSFCMLRSRYLIRTLGTQVRTLSVACIYIIFPFLELFWTVSVNALWRVDPISKKKIVRVHAWKCKGNWDILSIIRH
jgi:hypothetical protein